MAGTTISTTLTHAVTLSGAYVSPLTIAGSGAIEPGNYAGTAFYVPQQATLVSVVNHGTIAAGGAKYNVFAGAAGYRAVDLDSGTSLSNTNEIIGGTGGKSKTSAGGGGVGIDIRAASTVVNSGDILGGAGGYGLGQGVGGSGGLGVYLATAATLSNSNLIEGGDAGHGYRINLTGEADGGGGVSSSGEAFISNTGFILGGAGGGAQLNSAYGGSGGDGVALGGGGMIGNGGTISGGAGGGYNVLTEFSGYGGAGVNLTGATGTNTGLVEGGSGGVGYFGGAGGSGVSVNQYGSFTNNSRVIGGVGGEAEPGYGASGAGGKGIDIASGGAVTNTGNITGATGGYASPNAEAAAGGAGVFMVTGKLINRGTITAGAGGVSNSDAKLGFSFPSSGNGGYGVSSYGQSTVTNYGVILGGLGGDLNGQGGHAGLGGIGVFTEIYTTFANHGTVIGGVGGVAGQTAGKYGYGGTGGIGLLIDPGAVVINTGTIIGGVGGSNIYVGAVGGAGVDINDGGTFVDSGVVRGGAGGVSQAAGAAGDAVLFTGTVAGTLVLDPGASFAGLVTGDGSVSNVLELAGTSGATLSGVGSEFTGFRLVSFASGAERVVEGSLTSLDTIAGFAPHDTIVLDGFTASFASTGVSPTCITFSTGPDGTGIDLIHSTATDVIIADSGGKTTIAAAGAAGNTIVANAEQFLLAGGAATGSRINAGGTLQVENGGIATTATISGGALLLDVGGHIGGGVGFSTVTGGKLIIDSVTMPTATISGFAAGDTIKLAGVVYNPNDTVTVATAGVVTINAPGTSYKLDIAGATVGETDFRFGPGSVLTRSAAKTMGFLAPDTLAAGQLEAGQLVAGPWLTPMATPDFAELFTGQFQPPAPAAAAAGFAVPAPQLEPQLVPGIGFGGFTISDGVKLEMGAIHHGGSN